MYVADQNVSPLPVRDDTARVDFAGALGLASTKRERYGAAQGTTAAR